MLFIKGGLENMNILNATFARGLSPLCIAVVKNKTKTNIENLEFVWLAKADFPVKIKKIKKGDFKREGMGNLANGIAPLMMYYTDSSNIKHKYTILEELEGFRQRLICVSITAINEDGGLTYDVDPKYEPAF